MLQRKVALFGGTFDPIHLGHIAVSADAVEKIGAEKVIIICTSRSPLKDSLPVASERQRLEMIALAIAGNRSFELSDYELRKPGPSYTLETVRHFQADFGKDALLYWLIGADMVDELSQWYGIAKLIDECNLSVMCRAGFGEPNFSELEQKAGAERVNKIRDNIIETPLIAISSSAIRKRIAAGGDVSGMLHPAVLEYIRKQGLYR